MELLPIENHQMDIVHAHTHIQPNTHTCVWIYSETFRYRGRLWLILTALISIH